VRKKETSFIETIETEREEKEKEKEKNKRRVGLRRLRKT